MGLSGQCEIRSDGAGDEDRPVGSNHRESVRIQLQLTGIVTGSQLAIDGGSQTTVAATGLGATSSVAVTSGGTVYIADPTNNRIVVEPVGGGAQTTITTVTGVTPATLSGPHGRCGRCGKQCLHRRHRQQPFSRVQPDYRLGNPARQLPMDSGRTQTRAHSCKLRLCRISFGWVQFVDPDEPGPP